MSSFFSAVLFVALFFISSSLASTQVESAEQSSKETVIEIQCGSLVEVPMRLGYHFGRLDLHLSAVRRYMSLDDPENLDYVRENGPFSDLRMEDVLSRKRKVQREISRSMQQMMDNDESSASRQCYLTKSQELLDEFDRWIRSVRDVKQKYLHMRQLDPELPPIRPAALASCRSQVAAANAAAGASELDYDATGAKSNDYLFGF